MRIKTYVDTGILISAFRGDRPDSDWAMEILADPQRDFVTSRFLRLETLPKPVFHKRAEEITFMQTFFEACEEAVFSYETCLELAFDLAVKYNLGAIDSAHVAAAILSKADEFVSTEKPEKPMYKVQEIEVKSIY